MPLKAGSFSGAGYNNSMASAMETAFNTEWPNVMGDAPLPASSDQMKLMFVAIAQGVVEHLKQNCTSFHVTVHNAGVDYSGEIYQVD
jgi:hypothetical protein